MFKRKIKILYLPYGAQLYGDNRSLLTTLLEMKDDVEMMVCVTGEGPLTKELETHGIPYCIVSGPMSPYIKFKYQHYSLKNNVIREIRYIQKSVFTFFQLCKIILKFNPDIIHSNNSNVYSGVKLAKLFHIPHVWHIREYMDLDHQAYFPRKRFFDKNRQISHCIAITQGIFDHYQMDRLKDIQIYNGIIPCSESMLSFIKKPYFLYIGRLVPSKGIEDALHAFSHFKQNNQFEDYQFKILGDGDSCYITSLQILSQHLGIEHYVDFLGYQSDVYPYLCKAKALIVPSYFEAMGRITIEAMFSNCFIIGRNTGGTKELLDNEQIGLQFNSLQELVANMIHVASLTEQELVSLSNVRNQAIAHYSPQKNAQQILDFYNSILTNNV